MDQAEMFDVLVEAILGTVGDVFEINETESVANVTDRLDFDTDEWDDVRIEVTERLGCIIDEEDWPSIDAAMTLADLAAQLSSKLS